MNKLYKVPCIPKNIEIHKDYIYDPNLYARIPINKTAYKILLLVDGNKSVSEITEEMNKKIKVSHEVLSNDINNLLNELNNNYLLNWKYKTNVGVKNLIINLIAQYKKGYKERGYIKNNSLFSVFNSINNVIIKKIGVFFVWTLILYILSLTITSAHSASGIALASLLLNPI